MESVKTVLVTGANGFAGRNLTVSLGTLYKDMEIIEYDVDSDAGSFESCVLKADFIFHLAGVNRPKDESEFSTGNAELTERLCGILKKGGKSIPVLFCSSTQATLDNAYGRSKKSAEDALFAYGRDTGARVYVYRLPNLFGKWSRPNYNSAVATFCYNIARGLPIQVNDPEYVLTLAYIDDVVNEFLSAMNGKANLLDDGFSAVSTFYTVKLGEVAEKIRSFADNRSTLVMPSLKDDFDRKLYGTFLSYLETDNFGYELDMKFDNRGWLAEFIKTESAGQIFISRTKPGITRGNHWHHTKVEKFLVIDGDAVIRFRKIGSDEIIEYPVSGNQLKVLDIPAGYTHSIVNAGDRDVITLFWACEIFDPKKPDTYYEEI